MKKFADFTPEGAFASNGSKGTWRRCYEDHPPLPIGEFKVYGGSCISPVVQDADIYLGFDGGMKDNPKMFPWNAGESVLFRIPDGSVPASAEEAKKMIEWLALHVSAGRKVHLGCIGGHGRTGLALSALVHVMTGEQDAIAYVRKHYCNKAVESQAQVDWLHKHFGITKANPSKQHHPKKGSWDGSPLADSYQHEVWSSAPQSSRSTTRVLHPAAGPGSLWGSNIIV